MRRLKDVIRSILLQIIEKTNEVKTMLDRANNQIRDLTSRVNRLEPENERLRGIERDYCRIRRVLGAERTDELVNTAKVQEAVDKEREIVARKQRSSREYVR